MRLTIETERETDGRWIAEALELPGALVYGATEAKARAQALALRVLADRLEHGETLAAPMMSAGEKPQLPLVTLERDG